jgi:phosphoribosyl-ATP pyrophosphohydrolase
VKANATEDVIAGEAEAICANATKNSQDENCKEFADKLVPVLVSFLEETVNAEDVCALAEFC